MLFLQTLARFLAASSFSINPEPARLMKNPEIDDSGGLSAPRSRMARGAF
jgi:hypothetical protein